MPSVVTTILIMMLPLSSCGLFAKALGADADCERYWNELEFATSDLILRGGWRGPVADLPTIGDSRTLHLDIVASRRDADRYAIEGSFDLEGDPPATITGTVYGGCAEAYLGSSASAVGSPAGSVLSPVSVPPPAVLDAEVRDDAGTMRWRVTARGSAFADPLLQEDVLLLELHGMADGAAPRRATLERLEEP